jgi:hypothetical protein
VTFCTTASHAAFKDAQRIDCYLFSLNAKMMQIKDFALTPHQEQGRSPKGEAYRQRSGVRAISFDTFL